MITKKTKDSKFSMTDVMYNVNVLYIVYIINL